MAARARRSRTPREKVCGKCEVPKTRDEFQKNRANEDGLQAWCRDCQNTWMATYYALKTEGGFVSRKSEQDLSPHDRRNARRRKRRRLKSMTERRAA